MSSEQSAQPRERYTHPFADYHPHICCHTSNLREHCTSDISPSCSQRW